MDEETGSGSRVIKNTHPVIQTRAVSLQSPHSCAVQHALSPKQGEGMWATFPGDGRTWLDWEAI